MYALKLVEQRCSHETLLIIDSTKSYTAIANETYMHILSNTDIAQACRLWFFIRVKQSGFREREFVQFSVNYLANQLNVSRSTIQSWQRLLEQKNYLDVKRIRSTDQINHPNQYRACIPTYISNEIINGKKREKTTSDTETCHYDTIQPITSEEVKVAKYNHTQEEQIENCLEDVESSAERHKISKTVIQRLMQRLKEEGAPTWVQVGLLGLNWQIHNHRLVIEHSNAFMQDELKKFSAVILKELDANLERIDFKQPKDTSHITKAETSVQIQTSNKTSLENHLTTHTELRLVQRLKTLELEQGRAAFTVIEKKHLKQEIIFAMTQGRLAHLPKLHALNIALKLVRENRWCTPKSYTQPLAQSSQLGLAQKTEHK